MGRKRQKMNKYTRIAAGAWVAACPEKHQEGDKILVTTKYGKENACIVRNFVGYKGTKEEPLYCYSIIREDGFNSQERALKKAERIQGWADNAKKRSKDWYEKSQEASDFLSLGQPILVGHHSEKAHRNLLDRNWARMGKSVTESDKAKDYERRAEYWEVQAKKVDLSMPESLEFFKMQLAEATEYHKGLKNGSIKKEHMYSLTYARKKVKDLTKKVEIAERMWG